MQTQRPSTLWIALLAVLLLTGCGEVLNEYYISNHTEANLAVQLTPYYAETVDLSAGPLNPDIQKGVRAAMPQPVPFEQHGDTLHFTIPPKTSMFLGSSSGGNDLFSRLEVDTNAQQLIIDSSNIKQYFTVHDNFIGAIAHVFNIR